MLQCLKMLHERWLKIIISLTDPDFLNVTDLEINIIKNLALEKLHRQKILKEYVAVSSIESFFCLINGISEYI